MFVLAIALVIGELPYQPLNGISAKASGDARLVGNSTWHQLDINLSYKGRVALSAEDLKVFEPPPDMKLDENWTIKDKQLLPLVRLLHNVEWKPAAADAAAYERWRGGLSNRIALQPSGALSVSCIKNGAGFRLEFSGRVRVLEARTHGNRFGPNYQQDTWTHEILGAIAMTGEGVPFAIEIRDSFEVDSRFRNPGARESDDSRREGSLLVTMPVIAPLSRERVAEVKALINQLGDDAFAHRERAMEQLLDRGASITPYLRQFGMTHGDGEVRQRSEWLLGKLLEE